MNDVNVQYLVEELIDFLDDYADVVDVESSEGEPQAVRPNRAMELREQCMQLLHQLGELPTIASITYTDGTISRS